MTHKKTHSAAYVPVFATVWLSIVYAMTGRPAIFNAVLFVGGFFLWRATTFRKPIEPKAVLIPYLLTVVAFIVHVYEEFKAELLGYPFVLQAILHDIFKVQRFTLSLEQIATFAAFLAPILWITGAVMMLKRWPLGYFVASTFLFGMMFIEPVHYIVPFLGTGTIHYVGGTWTAFLPVAMGWFTFSRIIREMRGPHKTNNQS